MKELSRRDFLRALVALSVGGLAACGASDSPLSPNTPAPTDVPPTLADPTRTLLPAATAAPSLTATAQPTDTPRPSDTPIDEPEATATKAEPTATTIATAAVIKNVVVFIQENHTFDSLFAGFPGANSRYAGKDCTDALPADPPHQHRDALTPEGATTDASRCSYPEAAAPNYWKLARNFTLCDNFFSDVRGPSHPNYFMMMAAQTPIVNTPSPTDECPDFCYDIPTIANRLDEKHIAWRDYAGMFTDIKSLVGREEVKDNDDASFFRDAQNGTLPPVSWLNSGFLEEGDEKSGHPIAGLCDGENYAVKVLNAVMQGPQWDSTALFLVWDDWGGFYDHIAPPIVERWSDGTPLRYGFRVPCILVSPFARRHFISHTLSSFVSILHFIETLFSLKPLTVRDASASTMLDCFDFAQAPTPPLELTPRACG